MTTKSHFEVMSSDQCNNAEKRKSVNVDCKGKEIEISGYGNKWSQYKLCKKQKFVEKLIFV